MCVYVSVCVRVLCVPARDSLSTFFFFGVADGAFRFRFPASAFFSAIFSAFFPEPSTTTAFQLVTFPPFPGQGKVNSFPIFSSSSVYRFSTHSPCNSISFPSHRLELFPTNRMKYLDLFKPSEDRPAVVWTTEGAGFVLLDDVWATASTGGGELVTHGRCASCSASSPLPAFDMNSLEDGRKFVESSMVTTRGERESERDSREKEGAAENSSNKYYHVVARGRDAMRVRC